jgi:hypothetical protein
MTDPGAEAPIGPVLRGPRRTGERARILAVGALAVLVFGMGIGIAGNGRSETADATRRPATAPPPTASPPPSATAEPTNVPPTQNVGLGCAPVRLGSVPALRVSSDSGEIAPVTGLPVAPDPSAGPGDNAPWPVPGVDQSAHLLVPGGLLLVPDDDACVRYVVAEYRPADPTLNGPWPIAFHTLNVSPPRSVVVLGPMPTGDWVVRIVAYFSTGVAGQENANVVERFFRVISGRAEAPIQTPETPPAVPCTPLPASAPVPDLVLLGAEEGPTIGIPPGTGQPAVLYAQPGGSVEIRDPGDACARSWSIQARNVDTGEMIDLETQANPLSDPFQFAQNRWRLLSLPTGLLQLTATMGYSADVTVTRRWSLIVGPPDFPAVAVMAPDGTSADAVAGCGTTWGFEKGTSIIESCTEKRSAQGLGSITVPAGVPVRLDAGDWNIINWGGECGSLDVETEPLDAFTVLNGCDLGGSLVPGPAVFLPRSDAPIVRIFVVLEKDGDTASGTVFASVAVAP